MKKLVVLTGAGISQESGLKTFRDMGGLWENYDVTEVASPQGFQRNPALVLQFYNERRKQMLAAVPNEAHLFLKKLEESFEVSIITQNVDDLHERAGSSQVLHLHGQLTQMRSVKDENTFYPWTQDIKVGDLAPDGTQLRPHIVWFGEAVPAMDEAIEITRTADIFLIIGTSLQVYPAAGLVDFVPHGKPVILVDPDENSFVSKNTIHIAQKAVASIEKLKSVLKPK